ncbi:MAG: precorrin-3B C(17)-methyltransferase [Deltaproteobacteria bacterium]|nr:precorrin-3B C(17)-methyltransferase [Deltaproteobacteria bacterium]
MRSSRNSRVKQGEPHRSQTVDPKRDRGHRQKVLYVIGIGPGSPDHLSKRARDILKSVDTVAGYTTYIDLVRPLIADKKVISTTMTKEVERVEAAINTALDGNSCAIISSGDPGIYAMAGLVFEMCKLKEIPIRPLSFDERTLDGESALQVEVVPGIPALCAGASLLGAPLTHDFAVISLSDLLTPWDLIEKRIEAAARADFVIVIYNPKSKKRSTQLEKAQKIVLQHRDQNTPVGIVTGAMRKNQDVQIVSLKALHEAAVNMQTTLFIGSSASVKYLDFMVTPRGYAKKYRIDSE